MNRKTLGRLFRYSMLICFVTFMALFISGRTGYLEYQNRKQVEFTESQIKKFEEDVAEGKAVDIDEYLKDNTKNYQTNLSRAGLKISKAMGGSVKMIVNKSFKFLSQFAE